jgi:ribosomal protein S18 acetylase RimI-like enzyme
VRQVAKPQSAGVTDGRAPTTTLILPSRGPDERVMTGAQIRELREEDYPFLRSVVNDWWGGRQIADLMHRLFFQHFQSTGFTAVEEDATHRIVGFLLGFVSPTHPDQAYIHLVGIDPAYRGRGMGRELYRRFFDTARQQGCRYVRAITSPANTGSVQFHRRMGFEIEVGDASAADGTSVHSNYSGEGQARVCFVKDLNR